MKVKVFVFCAIAVAVRSQELKTTDGNLILQSQEGKNVRPIGN
jgi:hypothetical protein